MPLYEFFCTDCNKDFEVRRALSEGTANVTCPLCAGQRIRRVFTPVIAFSNGRNGSSAIGGSGCARCTVSTCASCPLMRRP
jgi:putative FmdB family regulatory protein